MVDDAKEPCTICKGIGWVQTSDLSVRVCHCLNVKRIQAFIGPELAKAGPVPGLKGPLYAIDPKFQYDPASLDRTTENLLILSRWPVLAPHLRLALGHKHLQDPSFTYHMDIDQHLLNVYLGNEHAKWKQSMRGYNSLKDLVEDPSLVILRLGYIGHMNKAAANVLREALMIREFVHRPTWIVKNPNAAYPISWDEVVAAYLDERFETVDLTKEDAGAMEPEPVRESPGMEVEEAAPRPHARMRDASPELSRLSSSAIEDDPRLGGADDRKHYRSNGPKKKRTPGEGPV